MCTVSAGYVLKGWISKINPANALPWGRANETTGARHFHIFSPYIWGGFRQTTTASRTDLFAFVWAVINPQALQAQQCPYSAFC